MKIGITGADGFLGSHLVPLLEQNGYEIVKITRKNNYDILQPNVLNNLPDMDIIVHLAAQSYVPDSYKKPQQFFETNVNGTNNILDVARQRKAKFIFISSYVYGNPNEIPTPESHECIAPNPYAASKILGEKMCEYYTDFFDVPSIILRPFNIYGNNQADNFLIPKIIGQAHTGHIELFDSKPKRDYIHVYDVVDAIYASIRAENNAYNQAYNIGSGTSFSVADIVDMVTEFSDKEITVKFNPSDRPNEIMETMADISKAKKLLDWEPKIELQAGLQKMINGLN